MNVINYPKTVKIVEVGARDGLQNESKVTSGQKVKLIESLAKAGLKHIEAGAFVSPKWVPQMADSYDVIKQLRVSKDVQLSALTPNLKGAQRAIEAGVKEFAIFTAASESFAQKNINCSINESIERFRPVLELAKQHNIKVRGYISCVVGCPYEGYIEPTNVLKVCKLLFELGCFEISLGDTIGVGTPNQVEILLNELFKELPKDKIAVHFHDTYGQAIANIHTALKLGISIIDSAVAGLGGCPYAQGASGNVATEDVLYLLKGLGVETNISLKSVNQAGWEICSALGKKPNSKVSLALNSSN
jgi:hydroxymethylglutaryl-CoA lyase